MSRYCENIPQSAKINLIVALPAEARPFIRYLCLKRISINNQFQIFKNKNDSIHLIVSGMGKIKSAAACAYLHAFTGSLSHTVYLNVGIAGSANFSLGEWVAAHKIQDAATNQAIYPSAFLLKFAKQAPLITIDRPQTQYPDFGLIDMEASGFFQAASQCVCHEQIQVMKIVSDNKIEEQVALKPSYVENLINNNLVIIEPSLQQLISLSEQQMIKIDNTCFSQFCNKWHFSTYQQHQLRELLRRWQVWSPAIDPLNYCKKASTSHVVLSSLTEYLNQFEYIWS